VTERIAQRIRDTARLPLALTAALAIALSALVLYLRDTLSWIDHTNVVIGQLRLVEKLLVDQETGIRGYLLFRDPVFLEPYTFGSKQLDQAFTELSALVADNPPQIAASRELKAKVDAILEFRRGTVSHALTAALDHARGLEQKQMMDDIRQRIATMLEREQDLRSGRIRSSQRATAIAILAALALVAMFDVIALRFTRRVAFDVSSRYEEALAAERAAERDLRMLAADLERRVAARTAELQSVNAELEAFSYSVSHDLRGPLRAVAGFTEVLLEDHAAQLDQKGKEYLARVARGASRMGQLIDDLLQLSRIGRAEMTHAPIDVTACARAVAAELVERSGAKTRVDVQEGMRAEGDPRLVRVLLENLIGNALKFSRKIAEPRIEVGEVQAPLHAFYVRDNGAGFDPQYAAKLFNPFQRLHRESEFEGTGIGLATVQRVVARHGGTAWAEGAIGKGATFWFTLAPQPQEARSAG
jgi:signal transduction histidine kinase